MKRIDYLDNLGGLLICYMMLNHILLRGLIWCNVDNIWLEPLQFFMFWFFFKSGMFYTPKDTKQIVIRGGRKLLLPLLIYSILGHVVECINLYIAGDYNWKHYLLTPFKEFICTGSVTGNHPLWFLFSLFFVQLIFNGLYVRKVQPVCTLLLGIAIPISLFYVDARLPIFIANISLGVAVYAIGLLMKERQFDIKIGTISLMLYLGIMIICPSHLIFRSNTLNVNGNYFFAILFSLAGCIVFDNLFKRIPNIQLLQFIGKNSMTYYVTHWIILNICSLILVRCFHMHGSLVFVLMVIACVLIPTLIIKIENKNNI